MGGTGNGLVLLEDWWLGERGVRGAFWPVFSGGWGGRKEGEVLGE